MSLKDAAVTGVENGTVRFAFASSFHREKVADTKASRNVEEALLAIFKKPVRIVCVVEKDATPAVASGPAVSLVEAAEEVFGGL
jgi:hypothetical protein